MVLKENKLTAIFVSCLFLLTSLSLADFTPPKWLQLPDVTTTGLDVQATWPVTLADDFLCTETGYITDIHIWGSWRDDILPGGDEGNVTFKLSIYADTPAPQTGGGYSMPAPDPPLWNQTFEPGDFTVRRYMENIKEGWYDPSTSTYLPSDPPADTICWQYNFLIDSDPFLQTGTPTDHKVYWLAVQAIMPEGINAQFGWKTSLQHFNDDATWRTESEAGTPGWQELRYPDSHPFHGESIDLAFVITPEPATIIIFGLGGLVLRKKRTR